MKPQSLNLAEQDIDDDIIDRKDVDDTKPYKSRKVEPSDGLLYFYHIAGQNKGG